MSSHVTNRLQTSMVLTKQTFKQFSLIFQTFENHNQVFLQIFDRITVTTFLLDHPSFHFILDDCTKMLCSIEIRRVAWPDFISPKLNSTLSQQLLGRIGIRLCDQETQLPK